DQLAQGAAADAEEQLELEGAVLALAEADGEVGVVRGARLDGGDAVAVAGDADGAVEAGDGERAARPGQAPAQEEAEDQTQERHAGLLESRQSSVVSHQSDGRWPAFG